VALLRGHGSLADGQPVDLPAAHDGLVKESETSVPWLARDREAWFTAVAAWVAEQIRVNVSVGSLRTVKLRPWGAVLRAGTPSGDVIFKAVGPGGSHETTLLVDIGERQPLLAPDLIAVDHVRGWLLMPDHGEPIAARDLHRQIALIERLLPPYAELQQHTVDLTDRWIAAGVPDRRPQHLPTLLEDLLSGRGRTGPLPIDSDEVARFARGMDVFSQVCDALSDGPVSSAIDHADIHGTNVLLGDAGVRLIDWGDSCLGHPFTSLLVPLEWVAGRLGSGEQGRASARLIDAYLEAWPGEGDRVLLGSAVWAGYVARAVSNDEQFAGASPSDMAEAHHEIVALLRTWHRKRAHLNHPEQLLTPDMPW